MRDKRSRLYCDCGRILDRYQHICSECGYNNRKLTIDMCQASLRESMNKRQLEYYHRTKVTRKQWKEIACRQN